MPLRTSLTRRPSPASWRCELASTCAMSPPALKNAVTTSNPDQAYFPASSAEGNAGCSPDTVETVQIIIFMQLGRNSER